MEKITHVDPRPLLPHPLALAYRAMNPEQRAGLKDSVAREGITNALTLYEGLLLDGRNRQSVAVELGIATVPVREYTGDDPAGFVRAQNGARRHSTPSQLATSAVKMEAEEAKRIKELRKADKNTRKGKGKDEADPAKPATRAPQARDLAAQAYGVSPRSVSDAKRLSIADPTAFAAVDAGDLTLGRAMSQLKKREKAKEAQAAHEDDPDEDELTRVQEAGPRVLGHILGSAPDEVGAEILPYGLQRQLALDLAGFVARETHNGTGKLALPKLTKEEVLEHTAEANITIELYAGAKPSSSTPMSTDTRRIMLDWHLSWIRDLFGTPAVREAIEVLVQDPDQDLDKVLAGKLGRLHREVARPSQPTAASMAPVPTPAPRPQPPAPSAPVPTPPPRRKLQPV